jgi:hypothetical protein
MLTVLLAASAEFQGTKMTGLFSNIIEGTPANIMKTNSPRDVIGHQGAE